MGQLFTKDNAKEMQQKSVEARKANKAVADVLREELSKKVGDLTKLEWLTQKAINNAKDTITLKDIKLMQEILGEAAEKLMLNVDSGMSKDDFIAMIKEAKK